MVNASKQRGVVSRDDGGFQGWTVNHLAFLDYAARGAAAGRGLGSLRTIHQTRTYAIRLYTCNQRHHLTRGPRMFATNTLWASLERLCTPKGGPATGISGGAQIIQGCSPLAGYTTPYHKQDKKHIQSKCTHKQEPEKGKAYQMESRTRRGRILLASVCR